MRPFKSLHHNYFLVAARGAASQGGPHSAVTAIVFAALAIEALVNEIAEIVMLYAPHPKWSALAELLENAEHERASIELKWYLAVHGLSGQTPDKGAQPFQDLKLLFRLRNQIVHPRPETAFLLDDKADQPRVPSLVSAFVARGIIPPPENEFGQLAGHTGYVRTPEVAQWAIKTAESCRDHLFSSPTDPALRKRLMLHATNDRRVRPPRRRVQPELQLDKDH